MLNKVKLKVEVEDCHYKVFQAYFPALFADKEYTQISDHITKVDNLLHSDPTQRVPAITQDLPSSSSQGFPRSQCLICFYCGIPGHTSYSHF